MDGIDLCYAFQECSSKEEYKKVFAQGAGVVGGWTGALQLGAVSSEVGAFLFAPLGPIGSLVGAVAFGVAGSGIGYLLGTELGTQIYHFLSNLYEKEVSLIFKGIVCADQLEKSTARLKLSEESKTFYNNRVQELRVLVAKANQEKERALKTYEQRKLLSEAADKRKAEADKRLLECKKETANAVKQQEASQERLKAIQQLETQKKQIDKEIIEARKRAEELEAIANEKRAIHEQKNRDAEQSQKEFEMAQARAIESSRKTAESFKRMDEAYKRMEASAKRMDALNHSQEPKTAKTNHFSDDKHTQEQWIALQHTYDFNCKEVQSLIKAHPDAITADAWEQLAHRYLRGETLDQEALQRGQTNQTSFGPQCAYLAILLNPNHANAHALLGFMRTYEGTKNYKYGYEHLKIARTQGNSLATAILSKIESSNRYYSDVGRAELRGVGAMISQKKPEIVLMDTTPARISEGNYRSLSFFAPSSSHNESSSRSDYPGEVRSDTSDRRTSSRNESNQNAVSGGDSTNGSRVTCRYDSSDRNGDLYRCVGMDMHLSGRQGDTTRLATVSRDGATGSTTVHQTSHDNGVYTYSAPEVSRSSDAIRIFDRGGIDRGPDGFSVDYDRDAGGFSIPCGPRGRD